MDNKPVFIIIILIMASFLCYSTGAGFGSTLFSGKEEVRIFSHDLSAEGNGVVVYGDRNNVETHIEPPSSIEYVPNEPITVKRRNSAGVVLGFLAGVFFLVVFVKAMSARRKMYEKDYA